jgi:hypothetical protein
MWLPDNSFLTDVACASKWQKKLDLWHDTAFRQLQGEQLPIDFTVAMLDKNYVLKSFEHYSTSVDSSSSSSTATA